MTDIIITLDNYAITSYDIYAFLLAFNMNKKITYIIHKKNTYNFIKNKFEKYNFNNIVIYKNYGKYKKLCKEFLINELKLHSNDNKLQIICYDSLRILSLIPLTLFNNIKVIKINNKTKIGTNYNLLVKYKTIEKLKKSKTDVIIIFSSFISQLDINISNDLINKYNNRRLYNSEYLHLSLSLKNINYTKLCITMIICCICNNDIDTNNIDIEWYPTSSHNFKIFFKFNFDIVSRVYEYLELLFSFNRKLLQSRISIVNNMLQQNSVDIIKYGTNTFFKVKKNSTNLKSIISNTNIQQIVGDFYTQYNLDVINCWLYYNINNDALIQYFAVENEINNEITKVVNNKNLRFINTLIDTKDSKIILNTHYLILNCIEYSNQICDILLCIEGDVTSFLICIICLMQNKKISCLYGVRSEMSKTYFSAAEFLDILKNNGSVIQYLKTKKLHNNIIFNRAISLLKEFNIINKMHLVHITKYINL